MLTVQPCCSTTLSAGASRMVRLGSCVHSTRDGAHSRPTALTMCWNDSSGPLAFLLNGTRIVVIAAIGLFSLSLERNLI